MGVLLMWNKMHNVMKILMTINESGENFNMTINESGANNDRY